MILNDWFQHRRISGETAVGDDMLAYIVAVGWAGPKEEAKVEGWNPILLDMHAIEKF